MKKSFLLWSALLLFTQYAAAQEPSIQQQEMPVDQLAKQNRTIVQLTSEEISKTLPQKVDDYTTLLRVEGKDTTLTYVFEINTGAKSDEAVKKEDRTRMRSAVTKGICTRSKRFLDAEINISYLYIGAKSKAELFRFDVNKKTCETVK